MEQQKIAAMICFLLISAVMLYGFSHSEKAFESLKKVYGIFGIKLDFTSGGKRTVKGIFLVLCSIFFISSIALIIF